MLDELNNLKYTINNIQHKKQNMDLRLKSLQEQLIEKSSELQDVIEEKQFYKRAVDIIYERSVQELKDILNAALSTIFEDRDFAIDIVLTDTRGKSLQLRATEHGKPVNLKRGTPMGEKTVISAVLQMYYLQCKNSKILMLDEAYSAVSKEYTDKFFEFLHQMCEQLGFKIILITHLERFLKYGDKKYIFHEGEVIEEQNTVFNAD